MAYSSWTVNMLGRTFTWSFHTWSSDELDEVAAEEAVEEAAEAIEVDLTSDTEIAEDTTEHRSGFYGRSSPG